MLRMTARESRGILHSWWGRLFRRIGNVSEPFDLQSLKAQSSGIQHEIILLGNLHEPSGHDSGLHAEHFWSLASPLHEQAIGATELRQGVVAVGCIRSEENLPLVVFVDGYALFGGDIRLLSQVNQNVPRAFLRVAIPRVLSSKVTSRSVQSCPVPKETQV